MSAQPWLLPDERRDPELSQWFTPPRLAYQVVQLLPLPPHFSGTLLEPSAGAGALVRALRRAWPRAHIVAVEVDARFTKRLYAAGADEVLIQDFLQLVPDDIPNGFNAIAMNPPYEKGQAALHIAHALDFGVPTVALTQTSFLQTQRNWSTVWHPYGRRLQRAQPLIDRPEFGEGNGAMRDFCVWLFGGGGCVPLEPGEAISMQLGWGYSR